MAILLCVYFVDGKITTGKIATRIVPHPHQIGRLHKNSHAAISETRLLRRPQKHSTLAQGK